MKMDKLTNKFSLSKKDIVAFIGYSPQREVKDSWSWVILTLIPFGLIITIPILVLANNKSGKALNGFTVWFFAITIISAIILECFLFINSEKRIKKGQKVARISFERDCYMGVALWSMPVAMALLRFMHPKFDEVLYFIIGVLFVMVIMIFAYCSGIMLFLNMVGKGYYSTERAKNKVLRFGTNWSKAPLVVGIPILLKRILGDGLLGEMILGYIVAVSFLIIIPIILSSYQLKLILAKKYKMEKYLIGFGTYYDHE